MRSDWLEESLEVESSLREYVENVQKFRKKLLNEGCPLCGSRIETDQTKFHLIVFNLWICTGEKADACPMSEAFNDVFESYEKYGEGGRK